MSDETDETGAVSGGVKWGGVEVGAVTVLVALHCSRTLLRAPNNAIFEVGRRRLHFRGKCCRRHFRSVTQDRFLSSAVLDQGVSTGLHYRNYDGNRCDATSLQLIALLTICSIRRIKFTVGTYTQTVIKQQSNICICIRIRVDDIQH
jgi:hypothetical protein